MSVSISVRKFASSDAESVIALWSDVLPSSQPWNEPRTILCRKLHQKDGLLFVGEQNGQVTATVLAGYDGVRGWIYSLAVAQQHRRRGVGRRMLEEAERALLARGCDKVNLQVRATNAEVIEFYERCGFFVEDRASLGKPLRRDSESIADPVPTIQVNDQLTLSQITWDDKRAYLKHLNESDEFYARMAMMPFPYREIDADEWISKVVRETFEANHRRNWAIRIDGELVGGVGVFNMNLSETAFVRPLDNDFELRWFTPTIEVELCGHATLASAHALWTEKLVKTAQPIQFRTKSGVLTCAQAGNLIELDLPATPAKEAEPPAGLLDALGVQPGFVGTSRFDKFIVVGSEKILRSLKLDFTALRQISIRGVIVTSLSDDPQFDFLSRYFAPGLGIDEDPVTGAAHCCLGPYWSERLGKSDMTGFQASARGGIVRVRVNGDRVLLGGQAVTIMKGELL